LRHSIDPDAFYCEREAKLDEKRHSHSVVSHRTDTNHSKAEETISNFVANLVKNKP